jgi:hypothetical protein
MAAGAKARGGRPRIGALVRTYLPRSAHVLVLAGQLRDAGFDHVFIAADETRGPVEAGGFPKLAHSLDSLAALGLAIHDRAMWFCGDYGYYGTVLGRTDADFWLMVEYDVALRDASSGYWHRLLGALREACGSGIDLLGGYVGPYGRAHFRHGYAQAWKAFFAVTGLSPRAIERLYQGRLRERDSAPADPRGTHCEVFLPSELIAAGGFACRDLNALLPGSIDRPGFGPFRAVPVGHEATMPGRGALVHRVVAMDEYLTKGPHVAARHGWAEEFVQGLDRYAAQGVPRDALQQAADLARREAARLARQRAAAG